PSTISENHLTASAGEDPEDSSTLEAVVNRHDILRKSRSGERLRALLDLSTQMSRTLDLDDLLDIIVGHLFDLFKQAHRGFVMLQGGLTAQLLPPVVRARRREDEAGARYSRSLLRQCLETCEGLLSDDSTSSHFRAGANQTPPELRPRSAMYVPLCSPEGR